MSYEQSVHFAQTWGLGLLALCFAGALLYAFWPANREAFKHAARAALDDGDEGGQ
ncbi:MAG: cbb3-type cytochrome c oxidase subunit 3 [Terricaulis sp.]